MKTKKTNVQKNPQETVVDLLKYVYLALSGYIDQDIIKTYGIDKKLSSEEIQTLISENKSFGEFCKKIGLTNNDLQVKLFDYFSHYTIKDSICRYGEIVLEQERKDYNSVLQKIKKYNLDEILNELNKLAKIEVITPDSNLNQPDENLILTASEEPIVESKDIIAKSILVKSLNVDSAKINFKSNGGNITISNCNSNGDLPKSTSNAQLLLNNISEEENETGSIIKINNSTFNMTGYNCIEIGLNTDNTKLPKEIVIEDLDFSAKLSNNAILIFGTQDNAVITLKNCHFSSVSNCLRLSNKSNASNVTCNIIDCTCDAWDTDPMWSGFMIFEDYTSGNKEKEEENNLFAPDKITVNFINCIGPNGKIFSEDPKNVCGTGNADTQILYVYNDYGGSVPYEESRYPKVTFK